MKELDIKPNNMGISIPESIFQLIWENDNNVTSTDVYVALANPSTIVLTVNTIEYKINLTYDN